MKKLKNMKAEMIKYGSPFSEYEVIETFHKKIRNNNPWWKFWNLYENVTEEVYTKYIDVQGGNGFFNAETGSHLSWASSNREAELYEVLSKAKTLGLLAQAKKIEQRNTMMLEILSGPHKSINELREK